MKTIAYLDCPSGISGDMCLAALLDAGVPLDYLNRQLGQLGLGGEFTLQAEDVIRRGQRARRAQVILSHSPDPGQDFSDVAPLEEPKQVAPAHSHPDVKDSSQHHTHPAPAAARHLPEISQIITQADLPQRVKDWSLAIFHRLGEAEAAVHGIPIDQVHFHEVGATDAIVDIVGTCLGFDYLDIDVLVCSPLPTGQGRVYTAHGWLPVPAPAVLKLMEMRRVPLYSNGITGELVTPTGAAIVTTLGQTFGPPPPLTLHKVGLGAGGKDFPVANILRLWIGQSPAQPTGNRPDHAQNQVSAADLSHESARPPEGLAPSGFAQSDQDTVMVLETQVDDLMPQAVGYLFDRLFGAGALDVLTQPVGMKKARPGLLITVLCLPPNQADCEAVLFSETTTLGIRYRQQQRRILQRRFETVTTDYGAVSIKLAYRPGHSAPINAHPEFEDCAALARRHQIPWQVVHQAALAAWINSPSASLLG